MSKGTDKGCPKSLFSRATEPRSQEGQLSKMRKFYTVTATPVTQALELQRGCPLVEPSRCHAALRAVSPPVLYSAVRRCHVGSLDFTPQLALRPCSLCPPPPGAAETKAVSECRSQNAYDAQVHTENHYVLKSGKPHKRDDVAISWLDTNAGINKQKTEKYQ